MAREAAPLLKHSVRRGAGAGALATSMVLAAGAVAGPSPRTLALSGAAMLAGLALGGRLPAWGPGRRAGIGAGVIAAAVLLLLDPASRLPMQLLGPGPDPVLPVVLLLLAGSTAIGALSRGVPPLSPVVLAGGAAGAAATLVFGSMLGACAGAACLVGTRDSSPRARPGGWLLLPVGVSAVQVLAAVQPATTPAAGGAVAFALGAVAVASVFAVVEERLSEGTGAVLVLLSLAAGPLLILGMPELLGELGPWVLGARPARGRLLLVLPLVLAGSVHGLALGMLGPARGALPWLAGGLALGAGLPGVGASSWTAIAAGALVAIGRGPTVARTGAALLAIGLLILDWQGGRPSAEQLGVGLHRVVRSGEAWDREQKVRSTMVSVDAAVGPSGSAIVRAPTAWAETAGQQGRPERWLHHVEQQGTVSTSTGREAEAEVLVGHLAALLGPERPRAVVLGDVAGRALGSLLEHPVDRVDVSTPLPVVPRALATLDPSARTAWLSSRVRLGAVHPESLLRQTREADLILEVVRTPWSDAVHAAPDAAHLDAVRAGLAPDGVYVCALHLSWFDRGQAAAVARAVADRFEHVQLWLPPSGADTLVVVGGPRAPTLRAVERRFIRAASDLRALGVPSASVLAGFAVGDATTARTWEPGGRLPRALRLPDAVLRKPVLHLGSLATVFASPDSLWALEGADQDAASLARRMDGRRTFLELLDDASTGDLKGVFAAAQALVEREGPVATQALEALIEPQLVQARDALKRAVREGPSSRSWGDAQRLATTARMLSPRSPAPPLLLGEVALAQGNLNSSQEHFSAAAGLDPSSSAARTGLARVAIARRDFVGAEGHLREAVQLGPQDWQAWSNLGRHLTETGATEEAEEALRRAASMAGSESVEPHLRLAELYLRTERPTTALVHAERAVILSGSAEAFYLRGRSYFAVEELEKAEEDFRRAVLADSRHARARGAIGHIRALRGDLNAAVESFRQAVVMDPTNAAARENLDRAESLLRQQEIGSSGLPTGDAAPVPSLPPAPPR